MATIKVTVKNQIVDLEQGIFESLKLDDVIVVNDQRYGVERKGVKVYNSTIGGEIPPTQYFIETK